MANLKKLESLSLFADEISSSKIEALEACENLKYLSLYCPVDDDSMYDAIAKLEGIEYLEFGYLNSLPSEAKVQLKLLPNLKSIRLVAQLVSANDLETP